MALTSVLVAVLVVGLGYVVALSRRGRVAGAGRPSRPIMVHCQGDPDEVFRRLCEIGGRYRLDDADPGARVLVLSSSPTLFSWGFFYPVFVEAELGGGTRIEIDIKSRFIQFGPVVTHHQRRCAGDVEAILGPPAARVASR